MLGFAGTTKRQRTMPKNLKGFRDHIKDACDGDIKKFNRVFAPGLPSWFLLFCPGEGKMAEKTYQLSRTAVVQEFVKFKKSRPWHERIYISCDGLFQKMLRVDKKYDNKVEEYNKLNGTFHNSFLDIKVSRTLPKKEDERAQWSKFVREIVNPVYVYLKQDARPDFAQSLKNHYETIEKLNKSHGANYKEFC